ncbi:hypothetical protein RhiirA4_519820, partial [Rhizophagus irregularis]
MYFGEANEDNKHDGDPNSINDDSDSDSNSEEEMPDDSGDSDDDGYGGYNVYGERDRGSGIIHILRTFELVSRNVPVVRMRQEWKLRLLIYRFTDLHPMKCKGMPLATFYIIKQISIYGSLVDLYGARIGATFFLINLKKEILAGIHNTDFTLLTRHVLLFQQLGIYEQRNYEKCSYDKYT